MDIQAAAKKVRASKPKENLMVIRINYDTSIVLGHAQGITLLSALENAEVLSEEYGKGKALKGLDKNQLTVSFLNRTEYEQIKIATLLNISFDEVKQHDLEIT